MSWDLLGLNFVLQGVGAISIIDAVVKDTPVFVRSESASVGALKGSIVLNNIKLYNVATAVGVVGGEVVLSGNTYTQIDTWGQGNVYSGTNGTGQFVQDSISTPSKPPMLLDSAGRIFGKMHPQYADYSVSQFVSVKDCGAKGDGKTDDTQIIQSILYNVICFMIKICCLLKPFFQNADKKIIFFDAGTYIITSTIVVPPGSRIVGEAWTVIAGSGSFFQDQDKPQPVIKVGESGSCGVAEITDIIFSTIGPGKSLVSQKIQCI